MLECLLLMATAADAKPPPQMVRHIVDEAERLVGISPERVPSVLTELELKGLVTTNRNQVAAAAERICWPSDAGLRMLGY